MSIANAPVAPDFWSWLWTQGPTIVVLAFCAYLVGRALIAQTAKYNQVQEDRLKEYRDRIEALEKRVDECEEDRNQLRNELRQKLDR